MRAHTQRYVTDFAVPVDVVSRNFTSLEVFQKFLRLRRLSVVCPLIFGKGLSESTYDSDVFRPFDYAISSAISIILVKVFWRSSAGSASPVIRLSEMVSSASAFLPAAAAFRYSA